MHKNIFMIFKHVIFIFLVSSLRINQKALILLHKKKYAMWYIQIGLLAVIYHRVQFKGRTERIQHHSLLLDSFHAPKHIGCQFLHIFLSTWPPLLLLLQGKKKKHTKHLENFERHKLCVYLLQDWINPKIICLQHCQKSAQVLNKQETTEISLKIIWFV